MTDTSRKKFFPVLLCAGIFATALAIRILYTVRGYDWERDSLLYIFFVQNWVDNGVFPAQRICYLPFLLPFALAKAGMTVPWAFVVQNVLLGCLIPVEIFWLLRYLNCRNAAAFMLGLCAACHPSLTRYSVQALRENCYFFLALLLIGVLIRIWRYDTLGDHLLFGILAALLCACRLEGWEMPLFYLATVCCKNIHTTHNWKTVAGRILVALMAFGVAQAMLLYPVRDYVIWSVSRRTLIVLKK